MKPVEQRGASDCLVACLASILELPYEAIPVRIADPDYQHNEMVRFLGSRGYLTWTLILHGATEPMLKFGSATPEYHIWPTGYWIAGVGSPRIPDGEHAVVMRSGNIAWDPHPQREMGHTGFQSATIIMPGDPAPPPPKPFVHFPSSGMWLDWRPVEELTDEELHEQQRASLQYTAFGMPHGTLAMEEYSKVLGRGFAIGGEIRARRARR